VTVPAYRRWLALTAMLAGLLAWLPPGGAVGRSGLSGRRAPGAAAVFGGVSAAVSAHPAPRAEIDTVCDEKDDSHNTIGRPRPGPAGGQAPSFGPRASSMRAGPASDGIPRPEPRPRFLLCGRLTC
jgi:hypothetical protein